VSYSENDNDIDSTLQEVERILSQSRNSYIQDIEQPQSTVTSKMKALLTVEHKYLSTIRKKTLNIYMYLEMGMGIPEYRP
jgi:ubiquinone/menaquinone biosynthesis C-methylase UbiE